MKKTYEKPGLLVESFALSQSIAKTCDFNNHHGTAGKPTMVDNVTCGWDLGGDILWYSEGICTDTDNPDAPLEVGCYNAPAPGMTIFSS